MIPLRKIKVLHIIPTFKTGGAERLLLDIMKGIDINKFEPSVLIFKEKGELYEDLKKLPISVFFVTKKFKLDIKNIWKMFQIIKNEQPDIIHTHLGGDIYGRLIAHWLGIPVVSTEHNINKDERRLTTLAKSITARYAVRIIAVSNAVKNDILSRYRISPSKIQVVYNGIDLNRFHIKKLADVTSPKRENNETVHIGAVGRLVEQKGFIYLIEAIKIVKEQFPYVVCEIAGDGTLRNSLKKIIIENNLEKNIFLPGINSDILSFYSSLDLFVMPSLWEGLGIAVLEAAALEIPVIASSVDGLNEIIENNIDGILVAPGNSGELADRIIESITHYEDSQKRAQLLSEKIRSRFSISDMVKQYETVYENIIS